MIHVTGQHDLAVDDLPEVHVAPDDAVFAQLDDGFADLDGHVWEVAWNPYSPLGPKGEFQWNGA